MIAPSRSRTFLRSCSTRPRSMTRSCPDVMKQILLRVPAVFSEVRFRELPEPLRGHFLSTRKIMLPQHALNPDIDRERAQALISKKHHAVCDLRPHPWERAELFSKLSISQRRPRLEIRFARADKPRCRAQIFGAIPE